jgi:D-alanyl-D-alanine carboxypeptidase
MVSKAAESREFWTRHLKRLQFKDYYSTRWWGGGSLAGTRTGWLDGSGRSTSVKHGWVARQIGVLAVAVALLGGASALGSISAGAAAPSEGSTASGPLPARTQAKLQRIVRRFQETNRTPGVVVAIWTPSGRFVTATGFADLATRRRLKTDMQFKIASQTKTFTANLILQLVGEGKVTLDDRISKWIAGVPNGHRITIRQILNHTSGLGDGFSLPAIQAKLATGCTVDELLTIEATAPPVAAPGATWSYSNYGYNLLGRVVELATGQDLSTAIRRRIAIPLGLRRTRLPASGTGLTAPFTRGYGTGEVFPTQAPKVSDDATDLPGSCLWAHGGMVSTLSDMRIWSRAPATGALLKPAVWRGARKNAVPFEFSLNYNGPGRWKYGLGFVESGGFIGLAASPATSRPLCTRALAGRRSSWCRPNSPMRSRLRPCSRRLRWRYSAPTSASGSPPAQALAPNYFGADPVD